MHPLHGDMSSLVFGGGPGPLAAYRRALKSLLLILLDPPAAAAPPPMTMTSRPSLGSGEGEGRVQRVKHGSGSIAKRMPTLSLLLPPLL